MILTKERMTVENEKWASRDRLVLEVRGKRSRILTERRKNKEARPAGTAAPAGFFFFFLFLLLLGEGVCKGGGRGPVIELTSTRYNGVNAANWRTDKQAKSEGQTKLDAGYVGEDDSWRQRWRGGGEIKKDDYDTMGEWVKWVVIGGKQRLKWRKK